MVLRKQWNYTNSLDIRTNTNYSRTKTLQRRYHCFKILPFDMWKKDSDVDRSRSWSRSWSRSRFFQAGVGVGVGVAKIWSTPQPWSYLSVRQRRVVVPKSKCSKWAPSGTPNLEDGILSPPLLMFYQRLLKTRRCGHTHVCGRCISVRGRSTVTQTCALCSTSSIPRASGLPREAWRSMQPNARCSPWH